MYLRKITQSTTSSSAKLLFTSSSTTSALLLNNNIHKNTTTNTTKMMSTMTTTQTNFSSRRGAIFSLKQQQQLKKKSFSLTTRAMGAKVGDQISGVLQLGPWIDGMPTPVNMAERCKGKKVILVGLPGASCFLSSPKINTTRDRSAADSFVGNYSLLLLRKVVLSIIINKYINASLTNRNYLSHNITQTGAFTPT